MEVAAAGTSVVAGQGKASGTEEEVEPGVVCDEPGAVEVDAGVVSEPGAVEVEAGAVGEVSGMEAEPGAVGGAVEVEAGAMWRQRQVLWMKHCELSWSCCEWRQRLAASLATP